MRNHFALIDHRREAPATFIRSNGIYNQLRPMERLVQSEFKTVIQYQEDGGENLPENTLAHNLYMDVYMINGNEATLMIAFVDIVSNNLYDEVGLFQFFEDGFICAKSVETMYFRYDEIQYINARLRRVPLEKIKEALDKRMESKNGILESLKSAASSQNIYHISPSDD